MIDFKGHRFKKDIILTSVRWYLAYLLSYRTLEEMMAERGVEVDHTSVYSWVQKVAPQLEAEVRDSARVAEMLRTATPWSAWPEALRRALMAAVTEEDDGI